MWLRIIGNRICGGAGDDRDTLDLGSTGLTGAAVPAGFYMNAEFRAPTGVERVFNRVFGLLVGWGFGFSHNYLLQVRGRKSGRLFSTPINLLELRGKRFLVAPRGRTQWVRNAEAAGEVTLKKGRTRQRFRLQPIADANKPEILKAYLDNFKSEVQRYFPLPAGSPVQAFAEIAQRYPVFELISP